MIIRQKWGKFYPIRKSRSDPDVVVALHTDEHYNAACVNDTHTAAGTVITRKHSESIVYTGGTPGHTRQGANFCVHKKYTRQYTGNTGAPAQINTIPPGGCARTEYYSVHRSLAETNHTIAEGEFVTALGVPSGTAYLASAGQGLINQVVTDLKPDLTKYSLPNEIIDWKQLGSLVRVWNKTSSLVTNLGGLYLNYKFGIKPLGDDMLKMLDGILHIREEIRKFQNKQGHIISARKTILNDSIVKLGNTSFPPYAARAWRGQIDRKAHGYMVYQPLPLLVMGEVDMVLRGLLSVNGIELNPGILWDAIPFSFVVDWFTNVGDILEQYKHSALELPIKILVTYIQYKERIQIDSWNNYFSDATQSVTPRTTAGTWSVSELFHRFPIWPDFATLSGLEAKLPTQNQAILGISLGAALSGARINTFFRRVSTLTGKEAGYYDYTPDLF